ncbi:MAG TPA: hypothetical protein VLZ05_08225 [Mycobacterium sp.]|nr:hypothetical protein [Mycobacterium sp.]HUH68863.1 hypothetical protein [Mycobacterium sp.]
MPTSVFMLFPARRVITMEPSLPDATAVAVAGQRIATVGSFEELAHLHDVVVDKTFADAVVCGRRARR